MRLGWSVVTKMLHTASSWGRRCNRASRVPMTTLFRPESERSALDTENETTLPSSIATKSEGPLIWHGSTWASIISLKIDDLSSFRRNDSPWLGTKETKKKKEKNPEDQNPTSPTSSSWGAA